MKYIDADRLKEAVEKKYNSNDTVGDRWDLGYDTACEQILDIIDSLQQEQTKVDLEKEIKDYTETLYHETFGNGQGTLDEFDWEDIVQVIDDTAHHFYKLDFNARKEE